MLFLLVLVFPIFREVGKKKDIHHLKCFLIIGPEGGVRGLRTPQQLIWSSACRCGKGQLILGWTFPEKLFFCHFLVITLTWALKTIPNGGTDLYLLLSNIYLDQVSPQWELQTKIELQKEKMTATV